MCKQTTGKHCQKGMVIAPSCILPIDWGSDTGPDPPQGHMVPSVPELKQTGADWAGVAPRCQGI